MHLQTYVHRLERLAERHGAPVVRHSLRPNVMGRMEPRRIVLRTGLTPEQQLMTLVHEMTHLFVHRDAHPEINRTICEYEAEAVERWVGTVLAIRPYVNDPHHDDSFTDGLLACSVRRVRSATRLLLNALQEVGATDSPLPRLQSQSPVEINTSTGKEIVFDNKLRSVRNFIRLAKPL